MEKRLVDFNLSDEQRYQFYKELVTQHESFVHLDFVNKIKTKTKISSYVNGDFFVLWGVGSTEKNKTITKDEYNNFWSLMDYLSNQNFRVILHSKASTENLREALLSPTVSVILYSAHGNESAFYDYNKNPVPYDIFENVSPSLYQFVLSSCYGTEALRNYRLARKFLIYSWSGTIDADVTINWMASDKWSAFDGKK